MAPQIEQLPSGSVARWHRRRRLYILGGMLLLAVLGGCPSPEKKKADLASISSKPGNLRPPAGVSEDHAQVSDSRYVSAAEMWRDFDPADSAAFGTAQAYLMVRTMWNASTAFIEGPPSGPPRLYRAPSWEDLRPHVLLWPCTSGGKPWPVQDTPADAGPFVRYLESASSWQLEFDPGGERTIPQRPLEQFIDESGFKPPDPAHSRFVAANGSVAVCTGPLATLSHVVHTYHWIHHRLPGRPSSAFRELSMGINEKPWQELLTWYPKVTAYKRKDGTRFAILLHGGSSPRWMRLDDTSTISMVNQELIGYPSRPQDQARIDQILSEMELWEELSEVQWQFVEIPASPIHAADLSGSGSTK